ncbi:MAG TPA: hypothetical protein VNT03_14855 [Baekduia sp.]|nr:hypothetical protein [Baekduia sp.]
MSRRAEAAYLLLGVAVAGARVAGASARVAMAPVELAARTPVVGPLARGAASQVADGGRDVRRDALWRLDRLVDEMLRAPEVAAVVDRLAAGPLTEAVARSLARNTVPRRFAAELVASVDVDAALTAVLAHPQSRALVDALTTNATFEQLVTDALDSKLTVELTDRLLQGAAMQHAVEFLAASPELRRVVAEQSAGMAEQTMDEVRRRSVVLDDAAERTVRGWLRRPRPQMS